MGGASHGAPISRCIVVPTRGRPGDFTRIAANFEAVPTSWPLVIVANRTPTAVLPDLAERPNVRIYFVSGGGVSRARNLALFVADVDVVVFIDDDVVPSVASLEILASHACASSASVVTARVISAAENSAASVLQNLFMSLDRGELDEEFGQVDVGALSPMRAWALGVGAAFAVNCPRLKEGDQVPLFDETLSNGRFCGGAEDVDFFYQCVRAGLIVEYCARAVLVHEEMQDLARLRAKMTQYARADGAFYAKWRHSLGWHDLLSEIRAWAERVSTHVLRRSQGRAALPVITLLLEPLEKVVGAAWWLWTA